MKLKTIEASKFLKLPVHIQKALAASGVIAVNDVFLKAWKDKHPIKLYYGGYGSGKTVNIVDELIVKCFTDPYFRCWFGRKIYDTVRKTVHKTIVDRIKELGLTRYFSFSEATNGSMDIVCKKNGNAFYPFGCSNADTLKGIKDPSHIFVDECDQISFKDFGFLYSRLRTKKVEVPQFYGACNTEFVYQSHWVRKVLFDGLYKDDALRLKANYTDNSFIDQKDYYRKLQLLANGDAAALNAMANGEWGAVRTGLEFWKCFNETKHVKEVLIPVSNWRRILNPGPLHITLDENIQPYVTQLIWQVNSNAKTLHQVNEILSDAPNNNAPKAAREMVEWLISFDFTDILYIYGDPSSKKRSTVDENSASFYDKYIAVLKSYGFKVVNRVGKSAPEVSLSADFINSIYENNYGGWTISIGSNCFGSIEDYYLVKQNEDGTMHKPKVKDDVVKTISYEPQGHCSDAKRYFICALLADLFIVFKERKSKLFAV